ncbi:MAG: phosphoglycerate dehydrogenase [Cytophagales bacterium CG18_big_fil_WC_8_21_14_2_50_42_9]|nr:MAG: phosphoglycerate dehydrogenase [Cytophagales bacterium CG18_big_fil_WC_8_21_14_2_50_42_9]
MPFSCLIIDYMHPSIVPMLEALNITVAYQPDIKAEAVKSMLPGFDGLLVRSKLFISEEVLSGDHQLTFIARAGAGVDNIDEAALKRQNITLLNAPEGNCDAVGEFTLGLLLALFRNVVKADTEVRKYTWLREENRGEELMGKTVGIIGYGHMGRAFAQRLAGFSCEILAYDNNHTIQPDGFARLVTLEELYAQADVVSVHIPFTPDNKHLGNEHFFTSFKKNIWVLNTARGEVINQTALVKLLQAGKIKGAALDVLENEKLKTLNPQQQLNFEYLSQAENVILTPHIGGWTHQSYVKINEVLVQKIKAFLQQTTVKS